MAAGYGARYVFRKNVQWTTLRTRNWGMVDAHGQTTSRGTRAFEIYDNVFNMKGITGANVSATGPSLRGGDGVIFGNTFNLGKSPKSGKPYGTTVVIESNYSEQTCTKKNKPYPTEDQTTDLYLWDNSNNNVSTGGDDWNLCDHYIQAGRDYHSNQRRPNYQPYLYPHPLRTQSWPPP